MHKEEFRWGDLASHTGLSFGLVNFRTKSLQCHIHMAESEKSASSDSDSECSTSNGTEEVEKSPAVFQTYHEEKGKIIKF